MKKKQKFTLVVFSMCLLLFSTGLKAQYVSLNKAETKKLVAVVKTDQSAKRAYQQLEGIAIACLSQQPNPVDTIISEGHLVTDPKKIITQKALADMGKIYALGYTYKVSGKLVYLKKCIDYILAWAKINHAVGNPINNTKLDPLFEAYDLIKDEVGAEDKQTIQAWLKRVADVEITNPRLRSKSSTSYNNWNSHRLKVVTQIAYILNDKALQVYADTGMKRQIFKNLYANGSGIDFADRDALHYHIYTLEPLLEAATVINRATGFNYYTYQSPSGSSIQKSVEFLVPFATGEQTHGEFTNSKAAFDKKRADNHEAGYTIGAPFKPETAVDVLSFAAYFNPQYTNIVKKLMNTTDTYPNWQAVLNAVKK